MTSDSGTGQVVVVGVDGSEESVAALGWARRYAEATGSAVRAVMAWHFPAAVGPAPVGVAPGPVRDDVERRMTDELAAAVAKVYVDPEAAEVQAEVIYGHPAQVLIDESGHASLLVVGHRGHGKFRGMLLGSVSIHCVTNASCPVVVVRMADPD